MALTLDLLEDGGTLPERGSSDHAVALTEAMVETDRLRALGEVDARIQATRGTTHVSVADRDGNVASMTTSNGEASGYVVPGTGILLNNMLGEEDLAPGGFHRWPENRRISSMMAPSVARLADGTRVALGSGGSNRIRGAILQVVSHLIDAGLPLDQAVAAPRIHYEGDLLNLEPPCSPALCQELRREFPNLRIWDGLNLFFGGVHSVLRRPDGGLRGCGDPRRGGASRLV